MTHITKKVKKNSNVKRKPKNFNALIILSFLIGVLLLFSTYAWFYSSLDVKIKFVNLVVSNDAGLTISFDGVNFGNTIQISKENLIEKLKETYPNNTSQWPTFGLRPVSSNGISNPDQDKFNVFYTSGVTYEDEEWTKSSLTTAKAHEDKISELSSFVAFDIFFKNVTGSPISDNLYLDNGTDIILESGEDEEIQGLLNSIRIGFVRIGSVPLDADVNSIQNMGCNNNCQQVIYEPFSTNHTNLSISRVEKYGINLLNGQYYPTYAMINSVKGIDLRDIVYGQDKENFELQITRFDINQPLFEIPDGITKARMYIWLEGQDIDSFETKSKGADLSIRVNFIKDTAGYDYYNE